MLLRAAAESPSVPKPCEEHTIIPAFIFAVVLQAEGFSSSAKGM